MSRLFFIASATIFALTASPAVAKPFEGLNVGVGAGYTRLSVDQPISGTAQRLDKAQNAAGYRLFAGYDFRPTGSTVVGAELGVSFGARDVTNTIGGVSYVAEAQSQTDLTIRAGYVFGDNLLVYGRAGIGRLADYSVRASGGLRLGTDETGAVYGIGAEYAFGDHWGARAEVARFDGPKHLNRDQALVSAVYHF